jgi:hypothetical protein
VVDKADTANIRDKADPWIIIIVVVVTIFG